MTVTMTSRTKRYGAVVAAAEAGKLVRVGTQLGLSGSLRPQSLPIQGYPASASIIPGLHPVNATEWRNSDRRFAEDGALAGGPPMN